MNNMLEVWSCHDLVETRRLSKGVSSNGTR